MRIALLNYLYVADGVELGFQDGLMEVVGGNRNRVAGEYMGVRYDLQQNDFLYVVHLEIKRDTGGEVAS